MVELNGILTMNDLRVALRNSLGRKGMEEHSIRSLADYLLNLFGYDDAIVDNILSPSDRNVFYMLEDEGLLGIKEEEVAIRKGKSWRLFYWVFKMDRIVQLMQGTKENIETDGEKDYSIYEKVPQDVWERHMVVN